MELLNKTIAGIKPVSADARSKARARLEALTMPHWALGRLMDLAMDLAGMTGSEKPPVERKTIILMAGDHGVTQEGVSKYPPEVTPQMVFNIAAGGAGINALAGGSRVVVVDMGVNGNLSALSDAGKIISKKIRPGTDNMARGPAMSREEAVRSVEAGIEVVQSLAAETDVFGTGDMGIGNTTPSTAILMAFTGCSAESAAGPGTGLDPEQVKKKAGVLNTAMEVNRPDNGDGLDVLAKVGGFEIGGIAGVILGAASLGKPVVLDGFISTAACLIARSLCPQVMPYVVPAHLSAEPGHQAMMDSLGLKPYLDLGFRLGEGTGAAMTMGLVDAAKSIMTRVATFEEAAVSGADK